MVVTYSIKELRAIGNDVRNKEKLKELVEVLGIAAKVAETLEVSDPNYVPTIQKLFDHQKYQHDPSKSFNSGIQFVSQIESAHQDTSQSPLTQPVADFFKKAQQNFYAQANIDPTKVRRLSEIEAELIADIEKADLS